MYLPTVKRKSVEGRQNKMIEERIENKFGCFGWVDFIGFLARFFKVIPLGFIGSGPPMPTLTGRDGLCIKKHNSFIYTYSHEFPADVNHSCQTWWQAVMIYLVHVEQKYLFRITTEMTILCNNYCNNLYCHAALIQMKSSAPKLLSYSSIRSKDENEYSIIRIVNLIFEYSFVLICL